MVGNMHLKRRRYAYTDSIKTLYAAAKLALLWTAEKWPALSSSDMGHVCPEDNVCQPVKLAILIHPVSR
jgi:hypothetical protein